MVQKENDIMPRQNFMTISVPDTIQDMFNEFIKEKEITKTAALSDVIEMYMMAKDEELYINLKKKYLNVEEVRNMIEDRDLSNSENDFIFMKLGFSTDNDGNEYNGYETIEIYKKDEAKRGYTWFSTQALYYGMADKKVQHYKKLIESGAKVKILFGIGENAGGKNDIAYSAVVHDIISGKAPIQAPNKHYPKEWHGNMARIWVKISDIKEEDKINASMLKVRSTGADLKQVISNSQYHFGYVCFK